MNVETEHPAKCGGWWHDTDAPIVARPVLRLTPERHETPPDFAAMLAKWEAETQQEAILALAASLGVSVLSLNVSGWCATGRAAWAIPMRDEQSNVIGIRLRAENGQKWAVKGSRNGLFIPDLEPRDELVIVEGPSDLAAAVTLGWWAVGRSNCSANEGVLLAYIAKVKPRRIIIVPDNDTPGIRGADSLQAKLKVPSKQWLPPTKDLREFVQAGGTAQLASAIMQDILWKMPSTERAEA